MWLVIDDKDIIENGNDGTTSYVARGLNNAVAEKIVKVHNQEVKFLIKALEILEKSKIAQARRLT